MNLYEKNYEILGIRAGNSWQDVRHAYRVAVRKWHPDRFPQGELDRVIAEEHIKEINRAFRELEEYHELHGKLPGAAPADDVPASQGSPSEPKSEHSEAGFKTYSSPNHASPFRNGVHPTKPDRSPFVWIAAILLLAAAYILIGSQNHENTGPDKGSLEVETPPARLLSDMSNSPSTTLTIGMSLDQVYALLGTPTKTEKERDVLVWRYGDGLVFFKNNHVSDWIDSPDHRLKLEVTPKSDIVEQAFFHKGSTTSEVRAVQGPPISADDAVWDYGPSQVFFKNGRVTGWNNSPMHPLKIQNNP